MSSSDDKLVTTATPDTESFIMQTAQPDAENICEKCGKKFGNRRFFFMRATPVPTRIAPLLSEVILCEECEEKAKEDTRKVEKNNERRK